MSALTLFPLQFKRQDSVPIDIDQTFLTSADRTAYLTSPRRFAGQVVSDLETNQAFFLNSGKNAWILLGATLDVTHNGSHIMSKIPVGYNYTGSGISASRSGNTVTAYVNAATKIKWAEWPIDATIGVNGSAPIGNTNLTVADYQSSNSVNVFNLGSVSLIAGTDYNVVWNNSFAIPPSITLTNGAFTELGYDYGDFNVLELPINVNTPGHAVEWVVTAERVNLSDPDIPSFSFYRQRGFSGNKPRVTWSSTGITSIGGNKGKLESFGSDPGFYYPTLLKIRAKVDGRFAVGTLIARFDPPDQTVTGSVNAQITYSREDSLGESTLGSYLFVPAVIGYQILYRFNFNLSINSQIADATAGIIRIQARDGPIENPLTQVLFQKDVTFKKLSSISEYEGSLNYVHADSSVRIYLYFTDTQGALAVCGGSWSIQQISRQLLQYAKESNTITPFTFRDDFIGRFRGYDTLVGRSSLYPNYTSWGSTTGTDFTLNAGYALIKAPAIVSIGQTGGPLPTTKLLIGWSLKPNTERFSFGLKINTGTNFGADITVSGSSITFKMQFIVTPTVIPIDLASLADQEIALEIDRTQHVLNVYTSTALVSSTVFASGPDAAIWDANNSNWNGLVTLAGIESTGNTRLDYIWYKNTP